MSESSDFEKGFRLLKTIYAPSPHPVSVPTKGDLAQSQLTAPERGTKSEAETVLEMCPVITASELTESLETYQTADSGENVITINLPNPLAGLIQGFVLSRTPAVGELMTNNQTLFASIQDKVRTGITRGKNFAYCLPASSRPLRNMLSGNHQNPTYKFTGMRAPSTFTDFTPPRSSMFADLGMWSRSKELWQSLGFPQASDFRGDIFYFHHNPISNSTDLGIHCPINVREAVQSGLSELNRQLILYAESQDQSSTPSLKVINRNIFPRNDRILATEGDMHILHITTYTERAAENRMTIVMEGLTHKEEELLIKLIDHPDPAYPDLLAASLLWYRSRPGSSLWIPPGIDVVKPSLSSNTNFQWLKLFLPAGRIEEIKSALANNPFAALGKLDRGVYWSGKPGFAESIYPDFAEYLRQVGAYDDVVKRVITPITEVISENLN